MIILLLPQQWLLQLLPVPQAAAARTMSQLHPSLAMEATAAVVAAIIWMVRASVRSMAAREARSQMKPNYIEWSMTNGF